MLPRLGVEQDLARAQAEGLRRPSRRFAHPQPVLQLPHHRYPPRRCARRSSPTRVCRPSRSSPTAIDEDGAARFGAAMREHPRLAAIELQGGQTPTASISAYSASFTAARSPWTTRRSSTSRSSRRTSSWTWTARRRRRAPRRGGTRRSRRRRRAERAARPKSARVSATAAGSAGWYEGRRGWSPASGVGAAKWERIGDHASSAKLVLTPGEASARADRCLRPVTGVPADQSPPERRGRPR